MLCHLLTRHLSLYFNTSTHLEGRNRLNMHLPSSLSIYPVLTLSYANPVFQNTLYIPGMLRSAPWGLHAESQKKYSSSSQNSKFLRIPNFPKHSCKLIFHLKVSRAGSNSIIFLKLKEKNPRKLNPFVPTHQHLCF